MEKEKNPDRNEFKPQYDDFKEGVKLMVKNILGDMELSHDREGIIIEEIGEIYEMLQKALQNAYEFKNFLKEKGLWEGYLNTKVTTKKGLLRKLLKKHKDELHEETGQERIGALTMETLDQVFAVIESDEG